MIQGQVNAWVGSLPVFLLLQVSLATTIVTLVDNFPALQAFLIIMWDIFFVAAKLVLPATEFLSRRGGSLFGTDSSSSVPKSNPECFQTFTPWSVMEDMVLWPVDP